MASSSIASSIYPRFNSQTPQLRAQIAEAINALPISHLTRPAGGEIFTTAEEAKTRVVNWGFSQGYAIVCPSANNNRRRWEFSCIRHGDKTRNSRKLDEADRQRAVTNIHANGCKFMLYTSGGKKLEGKWMLGWTKYTDHNHPPLADPFSEPKLRHYRPHHAEAIALASSHRGIMTAKQNAKVLGKRGFKIKDKEFYNLFRKESKLDMSREEEMALLMGVLERSGFHPRVREEYILEDGVRTGRVIREIFFMSSDQILQARRFVSGFMYETDATFNTNKLRLLLSVMVGIDNTGKTFPMAFMYHTTESAKAFKFASNDTGSENDQLESSSDDEEPLPDSLPRASLPTFLSTALLPAKRPHKPSAKQQSQNRHDGEKRKKEKKKEIKANRTGTGRSKKAEALATTSQLDDTVFVFRSSQ